MMIRTLLTETEKTKFYSVSILLTSICLSAASVFTSAILGQFIENANNYGTVSGIQEISKGTLWIALGFLLEMAIGFLYKYLTQSLKAAMNENLNLKFSQSINKGTLSWTKKYELGDLLGRGQNDVSKVSSFGADTLQEILHQSVKILLFGAVMFFICWQLTLVYLLIMLLVVFLQLKISGPIEKYAGKRQEALGKTNGFAQDILTNRKTVKIFNAQPLIMSWYQKRLRLFFDASMRKELFSSPLGAVGWIGGILPVFFLCIAGAVLVANQTLTLGRFMTIYFLADLSLNDLMHYSNLFSDFRTSKASFDRIFEIIHGDKEDALWKELKMFDISENDFLLSFEKVCFSYDAGNEPHKVLDGISFHLKKGEKVAFVGKSGCGKSTLLKLVCGFLMPDEGTICLNGKRYDHMTLEEIRQNITYVPQEPFLFAGTIKENIIAGCYNNPERWREVWEKAQVKSFVENLPDGIETEAGERGASLSGGQAQRIAVARAFMKEAPILLLDEATSALDQVTEQQVWQSVLDRSDYSAVIVAHRLSTIKEADKIYVMEKGIIAEQGSHKELMEKNGIYAELYQLQETNE